MKTIEKEKVTSFCGVPTMYIAIINDPKVSRFDLRSVRSCISGGAALPVAVRKRFIEITGAALVEGYGLTEASPVTHCNPIGEGAVVKDGSIGIPFPETDAAIVDIDDLQKFLAIGEMGELAVRGPQVMLGYWNRKEETDNVLRDGWLLTGDIARMDEDGYFFIVDRKKDMIDVGGFKVYPREVEEVLFAHPDVKEAAVVGAPDEYRGEAVKAFVVLKPESKGQGLREGDNRLLQEEHGLVQGASNGGLRGRASEDAGREGASQEAAREGRLGKGDLYTSSMIIATAFPPPMHSVTRPVFLPRCFERVDQGREHPRPAASYGMAEGYRTAVHVEPVLRDPELLPHHDGGSGVRFVVLDEVEVIDPSSPSS